MKGRLKGMFAYFVHMCITNVVINTLLGVHTPTGIGAGVTDHPDCEAMGAGDSLHETTAKIIRAYIDVGV